MRSPWITEGARELEFESMGEKDRLEKQRSRSGVERSKERLTHRVIFIPPDGIHVYRYTDLLDADGIYFSC